MQINITGHHVEITDAIRDAVNSKLKKLHQHFPDLTALTVVLTVEKHEQTAEVSTQFLGQPFNAKAKADDMYQSIAEMATKLNSLLQRQKEKVKSHAHTRPEQTEPTEEVIDEE